MASRNHKRQKIRRKLKKNRERIKNRRREAIAASK